MSSKLVLLKIAPVVKNNHENRKLALFPYGGQEGLKITARQSAQQFHKMSMALHNYDCHCIKQSYFTEVKQLRQWLEVVNLQHHADHL